jgi:DNA (cytosine-5)-methyltransferase 1
MTFTLGDSFAGCGGLTQGAAEVDGIQPAWAANHEPINMASHGANFPQVDHYCEDITKLDYAKFPPCDLGHWSPACPAFADSRGERQYFDADTQGVLFEDELGAQVRDEVRLGRALMHEVPRYLESMCLRGRPVLAGTVENVIQARKWGSWDAWLRRIRSPDGRTRYRTRVIAVNSMHLNPLRTIKPPQSWDRLLVMFWLESIGRDPDVGKWLLRPRAWCPGCEEWVNAIQSFKKPGCDMGRYGIRNGQYVYRCPRRSCRNHIVEPPVLGAEHAIDWANPGTLIGERAQPLEPATIRRIRDGMTRYWEPLLVPSGGTWRDQARPLTEPMPARTARETDGLALPPLITVLRGQSCSKPASDPLTTVTISGAHHGLTLPPMLIPYYSKGRAQPATDPMGTLSTHDRYGLATGGSRTVDISQVRYRMLTTSENAAGMGFHPGYIILGNVKQRSRQIGQAITPVLGELAYSAIAEMLTGEERQPAPWPDQLGVSAAS